MGLCGFIDGKITSVAISSMKSIIDNWLSPQLFQTFFDLEPVFSRFPEAVHQIPVPGPHGPSCQISGGTPPLPLFPVPSQASEGIPIPLLHKIYQSLQYKLLWGAGEGGFRFCSPLCTTTADLRVPKPVKSCLFFQFRFGGKFTHSE